MEKPVTEVTKAASRAFGAVYMKCLYAGGMSYDVYTKMIECCGARAVLLFWHMGYS